VDGGCFPRVVSDRCRLVRCGFYPSVGGVAWTAARRCEHNGQNATNALETNDRSLVSLSSGALAPLTLSFFLLAGGCGGVIHGGALVVGRCRRACCRMACVFTDKASSRRLSLVGLGWRRCCCCCCCCCCCWRLINQTCIDRQGAADYDSAIGRTRPCSGTNAHLADAGILCTHARPLHRARPHVRPLHRARPHVRPLHRARRVGRSRLWLVVSWRCGRAQWNMRSTTTTTTTSSSSRLTIRAKVDPIRPCHVQS